MAVVERVYTVPFSAAYSGRRTVRSVRAMKFLKAFIARHMKSDLENVKIDAGLNDYMWSHGMKKPPRKVKIRVKKGDDGIVFASLLEAEKPAVKEVKAEKKPEEKKAVEKPAKENAIKQVTAEKKPKGKE